ncbi:MAG: hypothetical protein HYW33_03005 [Candidatus Blackburnbacteria bacterium]|nr:hypothetical protein [Candidatus Blackburnbacteria bacterium]
MFDYQDKNFPGRLVYSLEPGKHTIETRFVETPLRKAANATSLAFALLIVTYLIFSFFDKLKNDDSVSS